MKVQNQEGLAFRKGKADSAYNSFTSAQFNAKIVQKEKRLGRNDANHANF